MARLTTLDVPDRFAARVPVALSQVLFASACTGAALLTRALVDAVAPNAGPFALTMPFVLVATLFGRWQAGALTLVFCAAFAWYFVLPEIGSFRFHNASDQSRVVVNVLAGIGIVALAELFRREVRAAVVERDGRIAERTLYLDEFDHRVRNNFSTVLSLLRLQRRQASGDEARDALSRAEGRVLSIARAHGALYRGDGVDEVAMDGYLRELCTGLHDGLAGDRIALNCHADAVVLTRDRAITVGLLVNELVTNALKHAFPGGRSGTITVRLEAAGDGARLTVGDDGAGMTAPAREGGLGQSLVGMLVRQIGGGETTATGPGGTARTIDIPAAA